jgi:hypothetical protein
LNSGDRKIRSGGDMWSQVQIVLVAFNAALFMIFSIEGEEGPFFSASFDCVSGWPTCWTNVFCPSPLVYGEEERAWLPDSFPENGGILGIAQVYEFINVFLAIKDRFCYNSG